MKFSSWDKWISAITKLGAVGSILFFAIELQQNNKQQGLRVSPIYRCAAYATSGAFNFCGCLRCNYYEKAQAQEEGRSNRKQPGTSSKCGIFAFPAGVINVGGAFAYRRAPVDQTTTNNYQYHCCSTICVSRFGLFLSISLSP